MAKYTKIQLKSFASASVLAEEVFRNIRTVQTFNGQKVEAKRFSRACESGKTACFKAASTNGILFGLTSFLMMSLYAAAFSFGTFLYTKGDTTPGKILTAFFGTITAIFSLSLAGALISNFAKAKAAAERIYELIEVPSNIDSLSRKLPDFNANSNIEIEFKNVHFSYPSRPDVKVLDGLNLKIPAGKTVALVGHSGCGKSTIGALLQRLYDVDSGSITLNGVDIKNVNVPSIRSKIGIVSQEPLLFATTVVNNISYGKEGCSRDEAELAGKKANVTRLVENLPKGYDTYVGTRGSLLSGGQKQSIAIARAIVKEPKILLLDEATSALDTKSEKYVQEALQNVSQDATTVTIAHRLSTIKNADIIYVISDGKVVEEGKHEDLISKEGFYFSLVKEQNKIASKTEVSGIEFTGKKIQEDSTKKRGDTVMEEVDCEEEEIPSTRFLRVLQMNRKEWKSITLGCIAAMFSGSTDPLVGAIFGQILSAYIFPNRASVEVWKRVLPYIYAFLVVAGHIVANFYLSFDLKKKKLAPKVLAIFLKSKVSIKISSCE